MKTTTKVKTHEALFWSTTSQFPQLVPVDQNLDLSSWFVGSAQLIPLHPGLTMALDARRARQLPHRGTRIVLQLLGLKSMLPLGPHLSTCPDHLHGPIMLLPFGLEVPEEDDTALCLPVFYPDAQNRIRIIHRTIKLALGSDD